MRLLVTAGPTREAIDPVRFLSNCSSGRMGYAIARVAAVRGHTVCLVSGPVALPQPDGVERVQVVSAEDMLQAVRDRLRWCDALVMAAAVADWRPAHVASSKLKKDAMSPVLDLERTPDILRELHPAKGNCVFVGFAAESGNVLQEAERKLTEKGLDLIVANDISRADAGFEVETNQVTLLSADGNVRELPLMSKSAVGERLIEWVEHRLAAKQGHGTEGIGGSPRSV